MFQYSRAIKHYNKILCTDTSTTKLELTVSWSIKSRLTHPGSLWKKLSKFVPSCPFTFSLSFSLSAFFSTSFSFSFPLSPSLLGSFSGSLSLDLSSDIEGSLSCSTDPSSISFRLVDPAFGEILSARISYRRLNQWITYQPCWKPILRMFWLINYNFSKFKWHTNVKFFVYNRKVANLLGNIRSLKKIPVGQKVFPGPHSLLQILRAALLEQMPWIIWQRIPSN